MTIRRRNRAEGGQLFMAGRAAAILLVCAVSACCMASFAHSPEGIEAVYRSVALELSIRVLHRVATPSGHYIDRIVVYRNGEKIAEETFAGQTDAEMQEYDMRAPGLLPTDRVRVEAYCSLGGYLAKEVDVKLE